MRRLLGACLLVTCWITGVSADCLSPPTLSYRVADGTRLNYKFVGREWNEDERACVDDAFRAWNTTLRQHYRRIRFQKVSLGSAHITVLRVPLKSNVAAGLIDIRVDDNHHFKSAGLAIDTHTDNVSTCATIYKVTLHEIGHVLGLADTTYNELFSKRPTPSVMNSLGGANDTRGFIPMLPTECDIAALSPF